MRINFPLPFSLVVLLIANGAKQITALKNDLTRDKNYQNGIILHHTTNNLSTWEVISPRLEPIGKETRPIALAVLDIKGGKVYSKESQYLMVGDDSPS